MWISFESVSQVCIVFRAANVSFWFLELLNGFSRVHCVGLRLGGPPTLQWWYNRKIREPDIITIHPY